MNRLYLEEWGQVENRAVLMAGIEWVTRLFLVDTQSVDVAG